MGRYNKSNNRYQLSIEPMCLDDMLPEAAEVRALEVIINKMDIQSLGFTYSETKATGRKPYDPADMFKIYAYSYFNGIRSSRKIERECYRNIELMWLIGDIRPDFKTIADFRKDNKAQIKAAFQRFSMICSELGLIGKEIVAVDGSKFRASNSRLKYHSEKKIDEKMKHHSEKAEQYMKLLDASDKEEKNSPRLTRDEIIAKIEKVNKRLVELAALKEEVKKKGTIYETDPDARMMKTNNNGVDICHNVQIAVDDKNHMVVAVDVTSQPVDKEQLYNMAVQAKENMKINEMIVIADKGYYSASQFEKCAQDNINPIVSKADHSHMAATNDYGKESFRFDEERGGYICPKGVVLLPFNSRPNSKSKDFTRYANIDACLKCNQKNKCTTGKYRTILDRPLAEYSREVDKRTKVNMQMYHQRKQLVEHPFGTVKRAFGFSYFLTRGNDNVRTESLLHFLVYNMKRAINIVGTQGLREILQG
jgi:transposase